MRDPEMCFEMEIQNGQTVALMPYYYRNDYMGVEEQSVNEAQRSQDGEQPIRVNETNPAAWGAFSVHGIRKPETARIRGRITADAQTARRIAREPR